MGNVLKTGVEQNSHPIPRRATEHNAASTTTNSPKDVTANTAPTTTPNSATLEDLQLVRDALEESQTQLNAIIQSAMDAIITTDENQHVLMFNAAAERMFRCPAAEVVGKSLERFIPARFRPRHQGHMRRFGETGATSRAMGTLGAIWGVRADGEEFPIEASISQVDSGRKKLFTVILRDVTEQRQQEGYRARLAAIVDSSEDAILSKDLTGNIVSWNEGAQKLFGYTAAEVLGRAATIVIPPALHAEEKQCLAEVAAGRVVRREETTRQRKDGMLIQVAVFMSPVKDAEGRIVGASSISHDVTERRLMQDAL
jgi:PAS domain S-box-containing protein